MRKFPMYFRRMANSELFSFPLRVFLFLLFPSISRMYAATALAKMATAPIAKLMDEEYTGDSLFNVVLAAVAPAQFAQVEFAQLHAS